MATLTMTAGAVLDTVTEVASATSCLVKSAGTGARMLHAQVEYMADKQAHMLRLQQKYDKRVITRQKTLEIDQLLEAAELYMSSDPARQSRCELILKELEEAWGE